MFGNLPNMISNLPTMFSAVPRPFAFSRHAWTKVKNSKINPLHPASLVVARVPGADKHDLLII
jgi:hypothetical protein